MKKVVYMIFVFLSHNLITYSQHSFGFKFNGGLSIITDPLVATNVTPTVQLAPSGNGGVFYNLSLGKKSIIGIELLFNQVEGKEYWKYSQTDQSGNATGEFVSINFDKHISYLSLPVYYGFKFNRVSINLGMQVSYAITSSGLYKTVDPFSGKVVTWNTSIKPLPISNYNYGARVGIIYNLTSKLALEANYYYGFNNIFKSSGLNWDWKIQQGTIGFRYNILASKPKEEAPK